MAAIGNITTGLQLDIGQDGTGVYPHAFPGSDVWIWECRLIKTVSPGPDDASHPDRITDRRMEYRTKWSGAMLANIVSGASVAWYCLVPAGYGRWNGGPVDAHAGRPSAEHRSI
ncbi:MAG: hypothetical protein H6597_04145 [Flavobacteriales bacterium]|nr:hypothetical protein [Flavobacteriales bacterium]